MKVFTAALKRLRLAANAFDKAHGYNGGFLVQTERVAFKEALDSLGPAMQAVRDADRAAAAIPDYKEIALVFGTALGTALCVSSGYGADYGARMTDQALREIFKIEVDKPSE